MLNGHSGKSLWIILPVDKGLRESSKITRQKQWQLKGRSVEPLCYYQIHRVHKKKLDSLFMAISQILQGVPKKMSLLSGFEFLTLWGVFLGVKNNSKNFGNKKIYGCLPKFCVNSPCFIKVLQISSIFMTFSI